MGALWHCLPPLSFHARARPYWLNAETTYPQVVCFSRQRSLRFKPLTLTNRAVNASLGLISRGTGS
eukprot:607438-Amphidinium_carterae.2